MKTVKEIRNEANTLYSKSSHYIAGSFIAIGTIAAFIKSMLEIIGLEIGFEYLFLAAALFSPLEYGMIKAALLSYDHKAKLVKTGETTLSGLRNYFKIMAPFVGRTILVYLIQIIVLAVFVFAAAGSLEEMAVCLKTVLTGNMEHIRVNGEIIILSGSLIGIILALVAGFLMESYFSLSYYFVVEKDMGLVRSLVSSAGYMSGHFAQYILLRISYLPYALVSAVVVNVIAISFKTMFQQLITLLPGVPLIAFNLILALIVAFISSLAAVMLYKVKETLAITIFYKEIEAERAI